MSFFRSPADVTASEDSSRLTSVDTDVDIRKQNSREEHGNATSSLFASASDPTASIEESTSSGSLRDAGVDSENPNSSSSIRRIETLETGSGVPTNHQSTSNAPIGIFNTRQISDDKASNVEALMFASFQRTAEAEAYAELMAKGENGPYSKDHPEVVALASQKYLYMCHAMQTFGISGNRDTQALQRQELARRGLELISANGPSADQTSTSSPQPGAIALAGADMKSLNQMMQMATIASGLPPVLKEHIGHPLLKMSRYDETFDEVRLLGKGGFGKVYQVKHRLSEGYFAVKKIAVHPARIKRIEERGKEELDLLLTELRALSKLDHPNIVRYHDGWLEYNPGTSISFSRAGSRAGSPRVAVPLPKLLPSPDSTRDFENDEHIPRALMRQRNPPFPSLSPRLEPSNGINIIFEDSNNDGPGQFRSRDVSPMPVVAAGRLLPDIRAGKASAASFLVGPGHSRVPSNTPSFVSSSDSENADINEPHLVLHIQMALHPMTLAEYLSYPAVQSKDRNPSHLRHCFHIEAALRILLEILDGVQYLHLQGLAHRDLKPSNIFISAYTEPGHSKCVRLADCSDCQASGVSRPEHLNIRIGDFGLVTEIARPSASESTGASSKAKLVGTALYRPLEHSAGSEEKLDIYALGIIALEALVPFGTKMERSQQVTALKNGKVTEELSARLGGRFEGVAEALLEMVCPQADRRPTCARIREWIMRVLAS